MRSIDASAGMLRFAESGSKKQRSFIYADVTDGLRELDD
jgi:hypothetical protein